MKHEKIIKREDKSQVKIEVRLYVDSTVQSHNYSIRVLTKAPLKRIWVDMASKMNDWEFRSMTMRQREVERNRRFLEFVTLKEIQAAKTELWEMLKP